MLRRAFPIMPRMEVASQQYYNDDGNHECEEMRMKKAKGTHHPSRIRLRWATEQQEAICGTTTEGRGVARLKEVSRC